MYFDIQSKYNYEYIWITWVRTNMYYDVVYVCIGTHRHTWINSNADGDDNNDDNDDHDDDFNDDCDCDALLSVFTCTVHHTSKITWRLRPTTDEFRFNSKINSFCFFVFLMYVFIVCTYVQFVLWVSDERYIRASEGARPCF